LSGFRFLFLPHNASKGEKVEKQVRNKKHTRRGYSTVDIYLATNEAVPRRCDGIFSASMNACLKIPISPERFPPSRQLCDAETRHSRSFSARSSASESFVVAVLQQTINGVVI